MTECAENREELAKLIFEETFTNAEFVGLIRNENTNRRLDSKGEPFRQQGDINQCMKNISINFHYGRILEYNEADVKAKAYVEDVRHKYFPEIYWSVAKLPCRDLVARK